VEQINDGSSNSSITGKQRLKSSNRSLVEQILVENSDVIDPQWEARHAKLIYLKGVGHYEQLAYKARKYGKNPKALMGTLVNKELKGG
jgi:hypothetical protein